VVSPGARLRACAVACALAAPACSAVLGLEEASYDPPPCTPGDTTDCAVVDAGQRESASSGGPGGGGAGGGGLDASIDVDAGKCGDGTLDPGEACDDGNDAPGDGCSACALECLPPAFEDPKTGHCYRVLDAAARWADAIVACLEDHGALAAVTSADELVLVGQHVTGPVWLGGDDLAEEDAFTWLDGEPFAGDLFAPGEPDHAPPSDCLELVTAPLGLASEVCAQKLQPLCERAPAP
jgi:cysteine-rich repeat protein